MKILKQPWFLILLFVVGVYSWQYYSNPKTLEISSNKAEATTQTAAEADVDMDGSEQELGKAPVAVKLSEAFAASKIQNLEISTYQPMKIELSKNDGDQVIVSLIGEGKDYRGDGKSLKDWFQVSSTGNSLRIKSYSKKNYKGFSSLKKLAKTLQRNEEARLTIVIEFPEKYSFGKISLEGVTHNIYASDVKFNEFKVARVSGNLNLKSSQGKTIKVESVSGSNMVEVTDLMVAEFSSVSGSTTLHSKNTNPKIQFESVSGSLDLKIPENSQVEVNFESMTGELINEFGVSQGATNQIKFSSLSGSATIHKMK